MTEQLSTIPSDEAIERLWRFAEKIAPAKFIPQHLRGDQSSLFYLLATAQELGLTWTHSIRSMYLDKEGNLGMKGEVILALLQSRGFKVGFEFTDEPIIGSTCSITRPGDSTPTVRTWTMKDAERIKTHWDGSRWVSLAENLWYRSHPRTMCQWRSLTNCGRVAAADVIGGVYLPEELREMSRQQEAEAKGGPQPPPEAPQSTDEFVVGVKAEPPAEAPASPQMSGTVVDIANPEPQPPSFMPPTPFGGAGEVPPEIPQTVAETPQPTQTSAAESTPQDSKEDKPVLDKALDKAAEIHPVDSPPVSHGKQAAEKFWAGKEPAPPPPSPEPTFDDLLEKVSGGLAANKPLVARYLRSYLQIKALPKSDRGKLLEPLKKLAEVIDTRFKDLAADPEGLGNLLAGRAKSKLDEEFDLLTWAQPLRDLARKVMTATGQDADQFVNWLHMPVAGDIDSGTAIEIASMEPATLELLFPIFLLVKGRVFEVVDVAVAQGRGITQTFQEVVKCSDKPVNEWDASFAERILTALREATKPDKPAKAKAKTANEPSAPEEDWGGGFAF